MASITIDEAARYLNVSTRTISTYISQGIITYHKKQGSNRKFIKAEDIYELKEAKAQDEFSIKKFKELQAKVKKLESQLDVVLRILDTKQVPLGLSSNDAVELYEAAVATSEITMDIEHVEAWLPVFMNIDEYDLDVIQESVKTDKPWVPIIDLCISMIVYVTGNRNYETSLQLQLLHTELAEARRRLRLSALLHIEKRGATIEVDSLVVSKPETIVETVKKWAKNRHKYNA